MMNGSFFRCQTADPQNGGMAVSDYAPPFPENPGDMVMMGKTPKIGIYYTPGADAEDELLSPAMSISAYPNPFSSASTLEYDLKEPSDVEIAVYNLKGQLVKHLQAGTKQAGTHTLYWDGCDDNGQPAANGIYLYKLASGKLSSTRKVILLR